MAEKENFSVYNVIPIELEGVRSENPLHFLSGDEERGWHVARNLRKPLNHLDFLRRQEEIAAKLNLHNVATPPELFDLNSL